MAFEFNGKNHVEYDEVMEIIDLIIGFDGVLCGRHPKNQLQY